MDREQLVESIKSELGDMLADVLETTAGFAQRRGIEAVLAAAQIGRVEPVLVDRAYTPEGRRCRDCDHLEDHVLSSCPAGGSASVFAVDVVNEIVELLKQSGADTDFADAIETLTESGEIAALLRY